MGSTRAEDIAQEVDAGGRGRACPMARALSTAAMGRVARDACPTVAGQSRVRGMLLAARSAARLESGQAPLSAAYVTVARCGVAAFSLLSTHHRPCGLSEHDPQVRTRASRAPAVDPKSTNRGASSGRSLQAQRGGSEGRGKCPMTAEYALRVRPSGGVPTLRPWPPTAAHGGRSRPGGTCLPPACVEAAQAAYGPDAGWSGGWAWLLTHDHAPRPGDCRVHPERVGTCPTGPRTSGSTVIDERASASVAAAGGGSCDSASGPFRGSSRSPGSAVPWVAGGFAGWPYVVPVGHPAERAVDRHADSNACKPT
jgi:hypothetical protein